jgi:hypothetical protein
MILPIVFFSIALICAVTSLYLIVKKKLTHEKLTLLLTLAFVMCGCCETTITNHRETKVDYMQDGFPITIIDSCEYIRYANGQGPEFTHKGNCKFCAERRKKEQEELIRRLKED